VAEQAVIVDEEETELQDVPRRAAAAALSELNRGSIRQIWNHVLRPDIYSPP